MPGGIRSLLIDRATLLMINRASRFALGMQRAATTRNIYMLLNLTILELQNLSEYHTHVLER
jgi:hypothetical protein